MNVNKVLNAFEEAAERRAVRAVAVQIARRVPRPATVLDRLGRRRVPLAPRAQEGFVIEGREQAQASVLRRAAMRRRSI